MKGIYIIEAMQDIDERMILDAKEAQGYLPRWLKVTSLAACICCGILLSTLSIFWLSAEDAAPEPLPEALAEAETNHQEPEAPAPGTITLSSSLYPVTLTVPGAHGDHIMVDTQFYCNTEGEGIIENDDVIFSFYVDYNPEDQLSGLVWFILAHPLIEDNEEYYNRQNSLPTLFHSTILGSDEDYTYLLHHPGSPKGHCFDSASNEAAETYLTFAQDSIDILTSFIYDNQLTSDFKWKQRFYDFTITPTKNALAVLTAENYESAPTVTFSSEKYPLTLTVPELFANGIRVDTPFSGAASGFEEVYFDNVAFSFHKDYSEEDPVSGLVLLLTATPISEFDFDRYEQHKDETYMFSHTVIGEDSDYVYEIVYSGYGDYPFVQRSEISDVEAYLEYLYVALSMLEHFVQENDLSLRSDWQDYFTERAVFAALSRIEYLRSISPTPTPTPTPIPTPTPTP